MMCTLKWPTNNSINQSTNLNILQWPKQQKLLLGPLETVS